MCQTLVFQTYALHRPLSPGFPCNRAYRVASLGVSIKAFATLAIRRRRTAVLNKKYIALPKAPLLFALVRVPAKCKRPKIPERCFLCPTKPVTARYKFLHTKKRMLRERLGCKNSLIAGKPNPKIIFYVRGGGSVNAEIHAPYVFAWFPCKTRYADLGQFPKAHFR